MLNREYIFNRSIFHCHVSLPEGNCSCLEHISIRHFFLYVKVFGAKQPEFLSLKPEVRLLKKPPSLRSWWVPEIRRSTHQVEFSSLSRYLYTRFYTSQVVGLGVFSHQQWYPVPIACAFWGFAWKTVVHWLLGLFFLLTSCKWVIKHTLQSSWSI